MQLVYHVLAVIPDCWKYIYKKNIYNSSQVKDEEAGTRVHLYSVMKLFDLGVLRSDVKVAVTTWLSHF